MRLLLRRGRQVDRGVDRWIADPRAGRELFCKAAAKVAIDLLARLNDQLLGEMADRHRLVVAEKVLQDGGSSSELAGLQGVRHNICDVRADSLGDRGGHLTNAHAADCFHRLHHHLPMGHEIEVHHGDRTGEGLEQVDQMTSDRIAEPAVEHLVVAHGSWTVDGDARRVGSDRRQRLQRQLGFREYVDGIADNVDPLDARSNRRFCQIAGLGGVAADDRVGPSEQHKAAAGHAVRPHVRGWPKGVKNGR